MLLLSTQVCTCTHGKYNALDEVEAGKVVEEADEADEEAEVAEEAEVEEEAKVVVVVVGEDQGSK